jgi:rhodanese-related sulfurtransferase
MKKLCISLCMLLMLGSLAWAEEAPAPTNEIMKTTLGKYLTPEQAHAKWKADPEKVKLIDVRIPEEYFFIGHPEMAINIPLSFSTGKLNVAQNKPVLKPNEAFIAEIKKRFKPDETIIVMCRTGERSAKAVNAMAKEGYTNVYSVLEGFEGEPVKEEGSRYQGHRLKNGWKNSPVPWTYKLDEKLVYNP